MEKSKESTYWDDVYDRFHQHNTPGKFVWNEQPTPFFVRLIDWLKYMGVKSVMDAGCGDGRNLKPLIEAGFDVMGVDYSRRAIECCGRRYADDENLELGCHPLDNIPLTPGSLDVVICDHVLTHIRNVDRVLEQFYVLLKKGGYALLEFTSRLDSTYGQGEYLSENARLQHGVYLRYDEPNEIARMLRSARFNMLTFTSEHSTDPAHGLGYIRGERHNHHSYFVVAQKDCQ